MNTSNFTGKLLSALRTTAEWLLILAAIIATFAVIVGPFILIAGLTGSTWASIATGVWAIISFIFAMSLLHEFDDW